MKPRLKCAPPLPGRTVRRFDLMREMPSTNHSSFHLVDLIDRAFSALRISKWPGLVFLVSSVLLKSPTSRAPNRVHRATINP